MRNAMFVVVMAACASNTSTDSGPGRLVSIDTFRDCGRPDMPCHWVVKLSDPQDDPPDGYFDDLVAFAEYPDQTSVRIAAGWTGIPFEDNAYNALVQIPPDIDACGSGPRLAPERRVMTIAFDSGYEVGLDAMYAEGPVADLDATVRRLLDAMQTCTSNEDVTFRMCTPGNVDPLTGRGLLDAVRDRP